MLTKEQYSPALLKLLARWEDARTRSDRLFGIVKTASLYERPIPERHRIVFYLGHLEAFDCNLLRERLAVRAFHAEFDRLFAFGIDPVDGGQPTDQIKDWPDLAAVNNYKKRTRETLDSAVAKSSDTEDEREGASLVELMQVAVEHRLMHTETLAYMFHQLPFDAKIGPEGATAASKDISPRMIEIPAGSVEMGLSRANHEGFGWDNEYEAYQAQVPAFAISERMVTNGQYLEFIQADAYQNRELWSEADWNWKNENNIQHPVFWKRSGDQWLYRGMFNEMKLPLASPVYVSHAEATAYARWAGKSLPSEEQWQRAAYGTAKNEMRRFPWGDEAPTAEFGNFDFCGWEPLPVTTFPRNRSAFGVAGLLGNGWEWTSSVFAPFSGFRPFPFYPGYSADFFDGKHYIIKGGSAQTAACMLRRSFRNWFQPHYQYVYAGFRCVSN